MLALVTAAPLLVLFWGSYGTVAHGQASALVKVTPLGSHSGELCRNDATSKSWCRSAT